MRKFISAFIAIAITLGVISGSFSEIAEAADKYIAVNVNEKVQNYEKVKVEVNGKNMEGDMPAILYKEFTMVPIRFVADAIGAETTWDNDLREVTVKKSGTIIKVKIGETKATLNGAETPIARGATAIIGNDRTLLPIRFIAETLNFKVDWNNNTRSAILTRKSNTKGDYKVYQGNISDGVLINTFDDQDEAIEFAKLYELSTIAHQGNTIWSFYGYNTAYLLYRGKTAFKPYSFQDLEEAITEGMKWEDSIIYHRGKILWSYKDDAKNYSLYNWLGYEEYAKIGSFSNSKDAIDEALKWQFPVIYYQGKNVWDRRTHEEGYFVYRGEALLSGFLDFNAAIQEGVKWEDSTIRHKDSVVWSHKDNAYEYDVYKKGTKIGSFPNSKDAIDEAKKYEDSVINYQGNEVWYYYTYETDYFVYQGTTLLSKASDLNAAIQEGVKWEDSTIQHKDNVLWSYKENANGYDVYQDYGIKVESFSNPKDAITEAKKHRNSKIYYQGKSVWSYYTHETDYFVYQGTKLLDSFPYLEDAIEEGMKWGNSTIEYKDSIVWSYKDNVKTYNVYQWTYKGTIKLDSFSNLEDAIVEAKKWTNSTVNYQGENIWGFATYEDRYIVSQGETVLNGYISLEDAITEAMKWKGSIINNGFWKYEDNAKTYNVYQVSYAKHVKIGSFSNLEDAIFKAKQWKNSIVNYQGKNVWIFSME